MNRAQTLIGIMLLSVALFCAWTVAVLGRFWTLAGTVDRTLAVAVVVALWVFFGIMLVMVRELLERREPPSKPFPTPFPPTNTRPAPPSNALQGTGWIEGD